jgi:putative ABC transport system substrate-binding protein
MAMTRSTNPRAPERARAPRRWRPDAALSKLLGLGALCSAGALCVLLPLTGCAPAAVTEAPAVHFNNPKVRGNVPTITVLAPADSQLVPVVNQLRNELEDDFDVLVTAVDGERDTPESVGRVLARDQPKAVVLLNNSTARIYRKWARGSAAPPVSIILMASFAEELQHTIPNSVGIAYEVPAVTSFVGLRALGKPVNRVGVIYRKALAHYIGAQRRLAQVESISFLEEQLPEAFEPRALKAALVRLERAGVDALWLPNDNGLLTRQLVARVWLPYLDRLELPVIVGVPSLVRADYAFGVYGAIPDPEALAIQAADLIIDLSESEWISEGPSVRLPLSAKTYVSAPLSQRFGVQPGRLQNVDVVVGQLPGED